MILQINKSFDVFDKAAKKARPDLAKNREDFNKRRKVFTDLLRDRAKKEKVVSLSPADQVYIYKTVLWKYFPKAFIDFKSPFAKGKNGKIYYLVINLDKYCDFMGLEQHIKFNSKKNKRALIIEEIYAFHTAIINALDRGAFSEKALG